MGVHTGSGGSCRKTILRASDSVAPAPLAPHSGPRSLWAEEGPFRSSAEYSTWSMVRMIGCSAQSSPARQQDGHPPPALRSGGRDPLAGRKPDSAFLADPALPRPQATDASRGDPARSEGLRTPAHVARGLQALLPERDPGQRVAAASARPPGGEMRHRQPVPHLMIDWCVSSPRTDGHAADRTRMRRGPSAHPALRKYASVGRRGEAPSVVGAFVYRDER